MFAYDDYGVESKMLLCQLGIITKSHLNSAKCHDEMQGMLLHVLVAMGILQSHHFWLETEHVGEAYQKVLVCFEMMFFAVLHQYAYHAAPYSGDVEAKLKLQKKHE